MTALPDKLREYAITLQLERPRPSDRLLLGVIPHDALLQSVYLITGTGTAYVQLERRTVPDATGTNVWTAGAKLATSTGASYTDMNVTDFDADTYLTAVIGTVTNCDEVYVQVKLRVK